MVNLININHQITDTSNIYYENSLSYILTYEGLDGGSWYSLITKNLAIYSLSSQLRSEANFCFTHFQRLFLKVVPLALFYFF